MRKSNRLYAAFIAAAVSGLGVAGAKADFVTNGGFEAPDLGSTSFVSPGAPTGWDVLGSDSSSVDHIATYWQPAEGKQSLDMNGLSYGVIGQTLNGLTTGTEYTLTFAIAGNPDGGPSFKTLEADLFNATPTAKPYAPTNDANTDDGTYASFSGSPAHLAYLATFDTATAVPGGTSRSDMGWTIESVNFTASSSSAYLQFTSRTLAANGNYNPGNITPFGPALDAVSVVAANGGSVTLGSIPVPLPASAGVGFSLLGGFGLLGVLRKRLIGKSRIA